MVDYIVCFLVCAQVGWGEWEGEGVGKGQELCGNGGAVVPVFLSTLLLHAQVG